ERLRRAHVVRTFRSPDDLRAEIIGALSVYRQDDAEKLRYVAEIPSPPTPSVAHGDSLLGNRPLVGRRGELNLLTDWVARPSSEAYRARLLAPRRHRRHGQKRAGVDVVERDRTPRDEAARRAHVVELLRERRAVGELHRAGARVSDRQTAC